MNNKRNMHDMRKIYYLVTCLLLSACSTEYVDYLTENEEFSNLDGVVMSVSDFEFESDQNTRTVINPTATGMSFSWKNGDQVGVYTSSSSMANFDVDVVGNDAKSASFDGGGFSLTEGSAYYAFYPYSANSTDKSQVPVYYNGQTQTENGGTAHLASYDYMTANAIATRTNEASFNFDHLGSIIRVSVLCPASGTYKSVSIASSNSDFIVSGTVNLTNDVIAIENPTYSSTISLNFGTEGVTLNSQTEKLFGYMLVAPTDLSGRVLTISVVDDKGNVYKAKTPGKKMEAGKAYAYSVVIPEPDETPYVTFSAGQIQTFSMSRAVETLEYSIDGDTWTPLETASVQFGGELGDLRLRGRSSLGTSVSYPNQYSTVKFANASVDVEGKGDIRTLVDYTNYENVDCSKASFYKLFQYCRTLTSSPKLPSVNLASHCYENMFDGCSSLVQAPELPALQLSEMCYNGMFMSCKSLEECPKLPATSLANFCYYFMFYGCSKIINATELPATELCKGCYESMFEACKSLKRSPDLLADQLVDRCYAMMFTNCSSLSYIKMTATSYYGSNYLNMWVSGVAENGIFVKRIDNTWLTRGDNGIPTNWEVSNCNPIVNGHECVDLGVRDSQGRIVYFATENVSEDNQQEDSFAWAETIGEKGGKTSFLWSTYIYCNGSGSKLTKYNNKTSYGTVDNNLSLLAIDDVATQYWGYPWRIPTKEELSALLENCTWEWIEHGIGYPDYGFLLTNKNNQSQKSFFGAFGALEGRDNDDWGDDGYYWAREIDPAQPYQAYYLHFDNYSKSVSSISRCLGCSVRPVCVVK